METAAARVRRPILETPSVVLIGHTARGWLPDAEGRTVPPEPVTGPGDLPGRLISELQRVGDRHGALVTELPPDSSYVSGGPDGPFATILVPIHPFRLSDAIDWFHERLEPGSVNATVAALLVADEVTYARGEAPRKRDAPPEWRPVLVPSLIVGDSHRLVPTTDGPPCGIQRMLPAGDWILQMNSAAGPLRDAAHLVARQIALAWSEELSMLLDHGPDLSRLGPQNGA